MNILYILLLYIISVNSQQLNSKPIKRLGIIQYGKYAKGSDQVHSVNSSVTVAPVSDIPEVETAARTHEVNHNYSKSTSLNQRNSKLLKKQFSNNSKKGGNEGKSKQLTQTLQNFLVQSYLEAKINLHSKNVQEDVGYSLKSSTANPGNINSPTTLHPSLRVIVNNNSVFQRPSNNDSFLNATTYKNKSADHLKAVKDVIALQLLSYNGDPQSNKIRHTVQDQSIRKKKLMAEETRSNIDFNSDVEMRKKLAVIAAARAFMEILDA